MDTPKTFVRIIKVWPFFLVSLKTFLTMSESRYRLCIVGLLAVFVVGVLFIGNRVSENGRYKEFNYSIKYSPDGKTFHSSDRKSVLDTRTGKVYQGK